MNLIQALRLPNSQAVMTNIARFHYQNIYNVGLTPPIVTQSNLTFQIKGYTRNYRFLRLDYACVIYIADRIAVVASNGIDTLSSGFSGCYMASFRHNGIRYVAHIPTPNNSIKTSWNRAVKNRIIDNVVLFKPTEGLARIPGIIRKTKCSSVLKQNVLFYKTKRTSVNLFSYPNWHKKAPKKYVFFGAFYCSVFWLSHQKSLTLNKYIIFGFNAILIPLKRRYIIPPESWARHRLYSIMSVYVAL